MDVFGNDDEGYRNWLEAHPNGFVLNTNRSPTASYLMLHRANCTNGILNWRHENPTRVYTKWCSVDRREVEAQARQVGGELTEASCCFR